nr:ribonuclease R [Sulfurihydrogenibium subterraneum]
MELTQEKVLELLKRNKKGLFFKQIAKSFNLEKKEEKQLKKILKKLQKNKTIVYSKGLYKIKGELKEDKNLIKGKVEAHESGFGFLIREDGEPDLFIPPIEMDYLFDGDVVLAEEKIYRGKKEAKIVKILERRIKTAVGKLQKEKNRYFIYLLDFVIPHKIYVNKKEAKKYPLGNYVVVEITQYPDRNVEAKGRIIKDLGNVKNTQTVAEIVARKYDLPLTHSEEAIKEAESLSSTVKITKNRKNLTKQICFTIDPESARDHDDAVAIEKEGENYRLYVHIADVSHYVKEGSAIDKEAFQRGNTYYLPERALHMLPERLASNLCSLRPYEKKYAFTCEMLINKKGEVIDYKIYESVIESKAKLTYDQALAIILGEPEHVKAFPDLVEPLKHMEELAKILMKTKEERGSIDFDMPESQILFDEKGDPYDVVPYERHLAHRIIEEFMIISNETVARHMEKHNFPFIYRVHEKPKIEKVNAFVDIMAGLGYKVEYPKGEVEPKFIQKLIEMAVGTPEESLVRFLALRTMKQAKYSPYNIGHFGLASECYTHFTSPIRRYADVWVHRLLKKSIKKKFTKKDLEELPKKLEIIAQQCSQMERVADDAERDALDILKLRILKEKIGEEFEGIITGVMPFGLFVEIERYIIEGLISISDLPEKMRYDEKNHQLVGEEIRFRLGDKIKVKIAKVDEDSKKIDLKFVSKEV